MYDNRHGSEAIVINCPGCGDRQIDAAMGTGGDVIISAEGAAPWSVMQTHAGGGVNRHPVADGYTVTGHAVIAAFEFVLGAAGFIYIIKNGEIKLPPYTEYHKKRTLPIMITSAGIIIITAIYIFDLCSSVEPVEEAVEFTETALRIFIR